jgi:putative CocE/NonD family hydrolase
MPTVFPIARSFVLAACLPLLAAAQGATAPADPGARARAAEADFEKREVMIPMRDGVRLKTFVLVPKGAQGAPMLLDRTPYNASARVSRNESPHLAAVVPQMMDTAVAAGYVIVYQDVRGKYGSEGDYVMNRPLSGPYNPAPTDHATDTWDTIDWLVKNVPESNGRVGTIGGSYEGFTSLMSVIRPHPALRAAVPFAPMVDGWMGDDWFHNGAFRQDGALEYTYEQEATRKNEAKWWSGIRDTYDFYLRAGNAGNLAKERGLDGLEFWRALVTHTSYDDYWQSQAMDQVLAKEPVTVPMMIVSGLFDQEDIYGGPALFHSLGPKDPQGKLIHLVLGPWNHGGGRRDGREIGAIRFAGDTATEFRRTVMQPFLDQYLKDAPAADTPRVLAYETGANAWHRYDDWPRSCESGCAETSRRIYLREQGSLSFEPPVETKEEKGEAEEAGFDEYVSDPAKPVPYRLRPTLASGAEDSTWGEWLMDDQRQAASRPDVLVYQTEPLTEPLRLAGGPWAHLFASTTGSDADFVVKLIDVWPAEYPDEPKMGGYQQMIAADIFRGRFRENFAEPKAIAPGKVLPYRIRLPQASHTFLPGHRIMVQVQSSWFPLYDRNPQTFVPNIMFAPPESYVKATQRIWRTPDQASSIELPVIP